MKPSHTLNLFLSARAWLLARALVRGAFLRAQLRGRVRLAAFVATMVCCTAAHADWMTAVKNITNLSQALIIAATALCGLGGVGAYAYAGKLLLKKGGDRGDDVEMGKVGWSVLGGTLLLCIAYVALQSVETIGGSASDVGKSITIQTN